MIMNHAYCVTFFLLVCGAACLLIFFYISFLQDTIMNKILILIFNRDMIIFNRDMMNKYYSMI